MGAIDLYHKWDGPEKDLNKAIYHYTQSADKGQRFAATLLGIMYHDGEGVVKNYVKAVHYLERAAEDGGLVPLLAAIYALGGEGVEKNIEKAMYYVEDALNKSANSTNERVIKSEEQAISQPLVLIGMAFTEAKNYTEALKIYNKIFGLTYIVPMVKCLSARELGYMYYQGLGVERDYDQAFHYYEMGSNVTECESHTNILSESELWLGRMYFIGRGTQKDTAKAFEFLEHSYNLGNQNAAIMLCTIHVNGYEVERNFTKAIPYCEGGEEKDSCGELLGSVYYFTGLHERALPCLTNAAEKEEEVENAARILSVMHIDGAGIGRDLEKAREWAGKSSEHHKEFLLQLMDGALSEMLRKGDAKDYSILIKNETFRLHGVMGLTVEEEIDLLGDLTVDGPDIMVTLHD